MILKTTLPIDLSILNERTLSSTIEMPFFQNPVAVKITFKSLLTSTSIEYVKNMEFVGDDKGIKSQTKIELELSLAEAEEKLVDDREINVNEVFTFTLNNIVDLYRLKTARYWVERISYQHIPHFDEIIFQHLGSTAFHMNPGVQSSDPKERERLANSISDAFNQNQRLPLFIEFYLVAKKNLYFGRYDLSLLYSNIALESLVFLLSRIALSEEAYKELMKGINCDECEMPKYKTVKEIIAIVNLNLNISDDSEAAKNIGQLIKNVRYPNGSNLRNDLVHGKINFIENSDPDQRENAKLSFSSLDKLIGVYRENLPELNAYL